jgi:hypothetical protein
MTGNRVSKEQVMRHLHTVALAALFGLSALGCATVTPPAAKNDAATADTSCRKIATPDGTSNGALKEYCGTAAQWVEFDSRAALAGVRCRKTSKSDTVCLFNKQWENLARVYSPQPGIVGSDGYAGFGERAGQMLSMSISSLGYPPAP